MNQPNYKTTAESVNGWHGKLDLVYAQRQDSTVLVCNENVALLTVQRPFYLEGQEICHSTILHTGVL